jgi:hypothetical protein
VSLSNVKLSIAPALRCANLRDQRARAEPHMLKPPFMSGTFFLEESELAKKRPSQPRMKAAFIPQFLCFLLTAPA